MEWEYIKNLQPLMGGIITAWTFYGLTTHPKPATVNEQLLLAAVFSIIQAPLLMLLPPLSFWSLVVIPIALGLVFATFYCYNWPHRWLRGVRIGTRSVYPSVWTEIAGQSSLTNAFIVLNLKDGTRIFGWPEYYPDTFDNDHFLITDYEWLSGDDKNGQRHKNFKSGAILIATESIGSIEFVPNNNQSGEKHD